MWDGIKSTSHKIDQAVQKHLSAGSLEIMSNITTRADKIEALQRETLEFVEGSNPGTSCRRCINDLTGRQPDKSYNDP